MAPGGNPYRVLLSPLLSQETSEREIESLQGSHPLRSFAGGVPLPPACSAQLSIHGFGCHLFLPSRQLPEFHVAGLVWEVWGRD